VLVPAGAGAGAGTTAGAARRFVLDRPHGKLGNVGREALVAATPALTKNAARSALAAALPNQDPQANLLELPRRTIDRVLDALGTTAERLAAGSARAGGEGAAGGDGLPVEGLPGGGGGVGGEVDAVGGEVVGVPGDDREPVDRDRG